MHMLRSSALAGLLSLAAFAAMPLPAAHAGGSVGLDLFLYDDVRDVRRDRRGERRGGKRADRGFDGFRGDWRFERRERCRPRRALRKARRLGLRRAYIHRFGPRGVVVRGRRYGERLVVRFGGRPHCPIRAVRAPGRY